MVTRRGFISGGACCLTLPMAGGNAQEAAFFLCMTTEPRPGVAPPDPIGSSASDQVQAPITAEDLLFRGISPYGVTMQEKAWRKGDGLPSNDGRIHLGICFLDGTEDKRQRVRLVAPLWLAPPLDTALNFVFDVEQSRAQISITFEGNENKSLIGRDSRNDAQRGPTMFLPLLEDYIILHEFGHALGLKHEHQHPDLDIAWDKPAVYRGLLDAGIKPADVERYAQSQVFSRLSRQLRCRERPDPDLKSIMMYQIPPSWTGNTFSTRTGENITADDRVCVAGLYGV